MNRRRTFFLAATVCLLALVVLAAPLLAAQGGEQDSANAAITDVFKWLNFLIVFGALAYLIIKKAPAFFGARAATISAALTEAAGAKAAADRVLREAEEKLARLDIEVAALRTTAGQEASNEAKRLRGATNDEIEKISRAGRAEIDAAERAARMELRAIGAHLAVERAEVLLKEQIAADTQAALFHTFVESLPGSAN